MEQKDIEKILLFTLFGALVILCCTGISVKNTENAKEKQNPKQNHAKQCEKYHHSFFDKEKQTCVITVKKNVESPDTDDGLSKIFDAKCTVKNSQILNRPYIQKVTGVCDGMNVDVTFQKSINKKTKQVLDIFRKIQGPCLQHYLGSNGFRLNQILNLDDSYYDLLNEETWNNPACEVPVTQYFKHPENLSKTFNTNCTTYNYKYDYSSDKPMIVVEGECNNMPIRAFYEHPNIKNIKLEKCEKQCSEQNKHGIVNYNTGECSCKENAKAMIQSMLNIKTY